MSANSLPTWDTLAAEASGCTRCALHRHRSQVVFGQGDPDADLVLVGDAPGRHEDLSGEPFAGAVGNLVDNLLLDNGLVRGDVYLTTVVKCRTPGQRPPAPEEVDTCAPFLRAQLGHLDPTVVVAFGSVVTDLLLGREVPLHRLAGHRLDVAGVTLIPTHDLHAALQGNGRAMAALRRDMRTAAGIVSGRIAPAEGALAELHARRAAASPTA